MLNSKLKYSFVETFKSDDLIEHLTEDVDYDWITTNDTNKLIINEGVKHIGLQEFKFGCCKKNKKKIKSIKLPNSLLTIGDLAFANNYSFTNIDIPDNVTTIGKDAFSYNSLNKVTFGKNLKKIGPAAFRYTNLTEITIPNNVESIGGAAFMGTPLKKVIIKGGTKPLDLKKYFIFPHPTNTGKWDYYSAIERKLNDSVYIKNEKTHMWELLEYIITGPNDKKHLKLYNVITAIGKNKFDNKNISSIELPDTLQFIHNEGVSNNNIEQLILPNKLLYIGKYAFAFNKLTEIIIPASIITIEDGAFANNPLNTITIKGGGLSLDLGTYEAFPGDYKNIKRQPHDTTYVKNKKNVFELLPKPKLISHTIKRVQPQLTNTNSLLADSTNEQPTQDESTPRRILSNLINSETSSPLTDPTNEQQSTSTVKKYELPNLTVFINPNNIQGISSSEPQSLEPKVTETNETDLLVGLLIGTLFDI